MKSHKLSILVLMVFVGWLVHAGGTFIAQAQDVLPVARKLDEFGKLGGCDHTARLDNLAIELQNDVTARGVIIAYGPRGEASGTAAALLEATKNYFVNSRGLDESRFVTINGGRCAPSEVKTELWIVPEGATLPEATPLDEGRRANDFAGKLAEYETDETWYQHDNDAGLGIGYGNPTRAEFADTLARQPASRGYLVAFASTESLPEAWRRIAKYNLAGLREGYGIAPERLIIINGGRSEQAKIELWVLPSDAPPPASAPETDASAKVEAVKLGAFNRYKLESELDAKWIRESLADMLRDDSQAQGVFLIRLPTPTDDSSTDKSDAEPPVDLPKLTREWTTLLAKDYGIKEERITVLIGNSGDSEPGTLETWLVPRHAAMPDPNKSDEEEIIEESGDVEAEGDANLDSPPHLPM